MSLTYQSKKRNRVYVRKFDGRVYERSGLCRSCWSESQQTRFQFDDEGALVAIRCSTCKEWKPADLFPANRSISRGRHGQCRPCGTKARQAYRERRKVPCEDCGELCLPPSEKRTGGAPFPRCRSCFIVFKRRPEQRQLASERMSRNGSA